MMIFYVSLGKYGELGIYCYYSNSSLNIFILKHI